MVSRNFLLFRFFATLAVCIGIFVTMIIEVDMIWQTVLLILLVYLNLVAIYYCACPHCGKRFWTGLVFNPFAQSAGFCNYCGNEVKYKELAKQEDNED